MNRLGDYLAHIHQAASEALIFTEELSRAEFLADRRTQQAVIMNLIIIGEAATKVLDGFGPFAEAHPEIPWRSMRGMRNRIAHGYFEIDLDVVWDTVQSALPALLEDIAPLLRQPGNG